MTRFDAAAALRILVEEEITTSQWVPTMFSRLLALPDDVRNAFRAPRHRLAMHAAAPCPVGVKRRMIDWWGPILVEYYSASEGGRTMITSAEWLERPGSVGRHWQGGRVWVLDDNGASPARPAPSAGSSSTPAGGANASATSATRRRPPPPTTPAGTRFTVGDVGWLDDDGYLYLTDRDGDLIISGGVNIYPREAENVLLDHPAVDDAAVVGVDDPDLGQRAVAVVVPAAGVEGDPALAETLLAHCREHLARLQVPSASCGSRPNCPGQRPERSTSGTSAGPWRIGKRKRILPRSPIDPVIGRS